MNRIFPSVDKSLGGLYKHKKDKAIGTLDKVEGTPEHVLIMNTDRASLETDKSLDLRTKDRIRKLISKIDEALDRIEDGSYGYCEETGEPIGLERLEARPVATLSIEAQERHERMEKTFDDNV